MNWLGTVVTVLEGAQTLLKLVSGFESNNPKVLNILNGIENFIAGALGDLAPHVEAEKGGEVVIKPAADHDTQACESPVDTAEDASNDDDKVEEVKP